LLLGSASERRRKILAGMGLAFEVVVPRVAEEAWIDDPLRTARENAARKHAWCRRRYPRSAIITADTVIAFDGRCLTKPADMDDARRMFRAFSGKEQSILTGVALSCPGQEPEVDVVVSQARFRVLNEETIDAYFDRVHPLDKAGAYDIDQCPELIVAHWSGSRTNIMGLPRERVAAWLRSWPVPPRRKGDA
jgi:septum formation protein